MSGLPAEKPTTSAGAAARRSTWARRLLLLYPRAWRDRYGDEVGQVLEQHHVTLWPWLDMLLGALDARIHADLLPGSLTTMVHRIRTSEIAIFCAFVLFAVAWLPLTLVRDPLRVWEAATTLHPELLAALDSLDLTGLVATLAILVGGVPLLVAALLQAIKARRAGLLVLFALPLLAVLALAIFTIFALPASGSRVSSAPDAPLTLLSVTLQIALVLLVLLAVGGSTAALAAALFQSDVGARVVRFALVPAAIATVSLLGGLLAAAALTALIFAEAPQVSFYPAMHVIDLLLMLAAVVLAGGALRRGIQAAQTR
jgi:hypothetical protein